MTEAFYLPTDDPDRFVGTEHCPAPWSPRLSHGGPLSGLLVRAIEALPSSVGGPTQVIRITVDILGPVPIGEVAVRARVARPGRSVELVEADLTADGRTAVLARAWRTRVADLTLPVPTGIVPAPERFPGFPPRPIEVPPVPAESPTYRLPMWNTGYAAAIEWRWVVGTEEGGTPAAVWGRPRIDLVAGEPASPLSRLMLLADTANGLSRVLDVETWWFINTELTAHLHRQPVGEWFLLASRSIVESNGAGMTEAELFDADGRVGRLAQALMVGPR
jgi:hypothetical protein